MRKKLCLSLLTIAAVVITFGLNEAKAGLPVPPGFPAPPGLPGLDMRINGYMPPPPGVNVRIDSGRPYYVERERRVYIEEERPVRHYKKYKKHHRNHGRDNDHYGHDRHGHDRHGH